MNTETVLLKEKIELLKGYKMQIEHAEKCKPLMAILESEIEELSKPEEPACLSFLQLAEKHDQYFAFKIRDIVFLDEDAPAYLKVASYIASDLRISQQQARRFVAEIYLTLLAKELNVYDTFPKSSERVRFETLDRGEKALTYSPEAITMWNWYFGEEEGK